MCVEIDTVMFSLQQLEVTGKEITAQDQLKTRLFELNEGREVPVAIFNCLDFSWKSPKKRGDYPESVVSCKTSLSICKFYQTNIGLVQLELQTLGTPEIKVVVPDSELFDSRVFSFTQSSQERDAIAQNSRIGLLDEITELGDPNKIVVLWSKFCKQQSLKSPFDYTGENYGRIMKDPKLQKKVADQVKDSRKYMEKNGVSLANVDDKIVFDRTAWYLAMYMGEGQALSDCNAICLNLEDRRVPYWFQIGANGRLPILNPVDPNIFYTWRRGIDGKVKV